MIETTTQALILTGEERGPIVFDALGDRYEIKRATWGWKKGGPSGEGPHAHLRGCRIYKNGKRAARLVEIRQPIESTSLGGSSFEERYGTGRAS